MHETDFFKHESIKNLILFDIYDVDEFILNEVEKIKSSNLLHIFDVSKARRYSFEINPIGEDEYLEDEISKEEYLIRKQGGDGSCFTRLNYEDFQENFPLNELLHWYGDDWLINFQFNENFLPLCIKWVEQTEGDSSKKLRLRRALRILQESYNCLDAITSGWHRDTPLNEIQKATIEIFKRFDTLMIEGITNHFQLIFNDLFKSKKVELKTQINKNPFPRIFKDFGAFRFFEKLKEHLCKNEKTYLADYSFIFRQMQYDKYLYAAISESEFRELLDEEFAICLNKLKTLNNCTTIARTELYNLLRE